MSRNRHIFSLALAAAFMTLIAGGCSSSSIRYSPAPRAPEAPPSVKESLPASSEASYSYRISSEGCDCLEYTVHDNDARVEYHFRASYKMQTGILTEIRFTIVNQSDDTLQFDRGAIKVSSLKVHYQYNNKFLPLPWEPIPPRSAGERKLSGKEVTEESNWHKVAGEQLTVTLKGLMISGRELKSQTVIFTPENPNMGR